MRSILRLAHDARSPGKLGEHHSAGSSQRQTLRASIDTQDGNSYFVIGLEFFDPRMPLFGVDFSVDAYVRRFLSFHVVFVAVHDPVVMTEQQELCLSLK